MCRGSQLEDLFPHLTGARFIASLTAIFDLDFHEMVLRVEPFCARRVRRYLRECDVIRYQLSETDKMEFAMPQGSDLAIAEGVDPAAKVISDGETEGPVGREGRRPSQSPAPAMSLLWHASAGTSQARGAQTYLR